MDSGNRVPLELGWAESALAGETESGDRLVVSQLPTGTLIAVIDGLGHGPSAASAAKIASSSVFEGEADRTIQEIIQQCHKALKATRGVAMTLTSIDFENHTLTWAGVGNVDARLLRAEQGAGLGNGTILLRGGIVGYRIPEIRTNTLPIRSQDVLIMATDGIEPRFADSVRMDQPVRDLANRILVEHRKPDDALVVVARYTPDSDA